MELATWSGPGSSRNIQFLVPKVGGSCVYGGGGGFLMELATWSRPGPRGGGFLMEMATSRGPGSSRNIEFLVPKVGGSCVYGGGGGVPDGTGYTWSSLGPGGGAGGS